MVQPGRYRHNKDREYKVRGVARHSETEEEYVVYRSLYGDRNASCATGIPLPTCHSGCCDWSRGLLKGSGTPDC